MRSSGVQLVSRMNQVEINTLKKQNSLRKTNRASPTTVRWRIPRTTAKNSMRYRNEKNELIPRKVWRVTVSQAAQKNELIPLFNSRTVYTKGNNRPAISKRIHVQNQATHLFAHELPLLRMGVMFATNSKKLNVVIGPIPAAHMIAELLEYGGTASRKVAYKRNEFGQLIMSNLKGL